MKVNIEKEAQNTVKFDIEIPAKEAVDAYNKAVKNISQHVNVPGFRKGKAPRNLVEQHVGVERIKEEALDILLPNVFKDAIVKNNLDVISQPFVESYDFEVGKDIKVVAKVELRPEVKLGEYKNMSVEVEEYVTPADAFDKSLNGLMQRHASFKLVVDRASKDTDVVVIDFDGYVEGEKIRGGAADNYPLDLANSNFIPGFAEQLVGKKIGEEFEINVDFPKDYHEKKVAGKPAVFKINLKEIKEKAIPELTDEFAQKVGPFKTVEDLKADIQNFLDFTKKNEEKKSSEVAIFDKVLTGVKVDIQESMIEKETQTLLNEYKQRVLSQGFSWEDAIEAQGYDNLMQEVKKDAFIRIRNSLVIDKIAQEENIKIDHTDLDKKLAEVESSYKIDKAELIKQLKQNPAMFTSLSQQALNEKVMDFLAENNKVEFKKGKGEKEKGKKG